MTGCGVSRVVYALGRLARTTGIPRRLAGWGRVRFAMGMLGATAPARGGEEGGAVPPGTQRPAAWPPAAPPPARASPDPPPVTLFRGCIMDGLLPPAHPATNPTL